MTVRMSYNELLSLEYKYGFVSGVLSRIKSIAQEHNNTEIVNICNDAFIHLKSLEKNETTRK